MRPKFSSNYIQHYNGQEVILTGQILAAPEKSFTYQRLTVGRVVIEGEGGGQIAVAGKILVKTRLYPKFDYGDLIELQGRLQEPPVFEDFSYKEYLSVDGIYSLMNYPEVRKVDSFLRNSGNENSENFVASTSKRGSYLFGFLTGMKLAVFSKIYTFRKHVEDLLSSLLPEPQTALMMGIVFGIKGAYLPETYEALRQAGVLHVIVASGFNISVVAGALMVFKGLLGPRLGSVFILLGIFAYAVLAGLAPPIVRAAILGAVAVVAGSSGHQQHTLWWLFLTAYIMLFVNPLWIKSLSFQLSFLASLGILVVKPTVSVWFESMVTHSRPWIGYHTLGRLPLTIRDDAVTTFSVLLLTTPLIWWNFGEVSLTALLVNSLVLWTVPPLMFLGLGLVVMGLISNQLAYLLVYPIWLLLSYFLGVVGVFT